MVKRDTNLFKVGIPLMTVHELFGYNRAACLCFSMNEKGPDGWRQKASFRLFKSALLHDGYSVCVASLYFCFKLSTSL